MGILKNRGGRQCGVLQPERSAKGGAYSRLPLLFIFLGSAILMYAPLRAQRAPAVYTVRNLQTNGQSSLEGIPVDALHPELSWQVSAAATHSSPAGVPRPVAYQILVSSQLAAVDNAREPALSGNRVAPAKNVHESLLDWNSGKVAIGPEALFRSRYQGRPLAADCRYYWSVRVWDPQGKMSGWSPVDSFQTALFDKNDWGAARWIGRRQMTEKDRVLPGDVPVKVRDAAGRERSLPFGAENDTLPLFRKEFSLSQKASGIKKASLYISGLGQFEASLNGQKIGDHLLDPGWTNYQKEALYVCLDVTHQLRDGLNALGVALGNGFYFIPAARAWYRKLLVQYGYPKMICRLSIEYGNGKRQYIVSDGSWQTGLSSIRFSSIYGGELEDGRLRQAGWNKAGFKAETACWRPAVVVTDTPPRLQLQKIDPVRVMETFAVKQLYPVRAEGKAAAGSASWTYDMGQNCSGIPFIQVDGRKGDTVTLLPAELMAADHSPNQKATGKYRLIYILEKDGLQDWHPRFTYYGFRYIGLQGAVPEGRPNPGNLPVIRDIKTWHIRNSAPEAGHFSCSDPLFNQTSELIGWAMKSNMMSVFTDCPHREKLGWLEQVHLMGSSVRFNWQIRQLLKKSLEDMRSAQTPAGLIPEIAPEYTVFTWGGDMFRDSPEWGSSAIIVPWYLYQWYGDSSELQRSYSMMSRYQAYLQKKAKDHILYQGLGDWYDLGPKPPGTSQLTPQGLTATAIYYYDLQILGKIARLLGKTADRLKFKAEADLVREAFNHKFLHQGPDSLGTQQVFYGTGSQTADAMAVYMQLVPDSLRSSVVRHLVNGIIAGKYALTAGDIGYRYLLRVLEAEGYSDIIFKMNNRSDVPGYGYQIAHGATALTESWQALARVSNNHFMLGHLMEWFYTGVLGIHLDFAATDRAEKPQLIIAPQMVGDLTWAKGDYETPYGTLRVGWKKNEKASEVSLVVPVGLKAELRLAFPEGAVLSADTLTGKQRFISRQGKRIIVLSAGSGEHTYRIVFNDKRIIK